jgi:hypothetical protein
MLCTDSPISYRALPNIVSKVLIVSVIGDIIKVTHIPKPRIVCILLESHIIQCFAIDSLTLKGSNLRSNSVEKLISNKTNSSLTNFVPVGKLLVFLQVSFDNLVLDLNQEHLQIGKLNEL